MRMLQAYIALLLCLWSSSSLVASAAADIPAKSIKIVQRYSQSQLPSRTSIDNFPLNIAIFRFVNDHHAPVTDWFFSWYSFLGSGFILIPLVFILWWVRPGKIIYLLLAVSLESLVVYAFKYFWSQPRPALLLDHVHLLQPLYTQAFPSGDTAIAFAIACCLLVGETRRVQLWLLGYAVLIAYERMYMGVHFPLDVCMGSLIGCLASLSAYRLIDSTWMQKIPNRLFQKR